MSKINVCKGDKYNYFTIIKEVASVNKRRTFKCRCICGKIKEVKLNDLRHMDIKSCGCMNKPRGSKIDVKIGERYGKLTIVKELPPEKYIRFFECICDCGNITRNRLENLRKGASRSCGCLPKTHGLSYVHRNLYRIYTKIKSQCTNKNDNSYKYFGAKGISIYKKWEKNYESFYNWAFENGYKEGLTIDRINLKKNFTPKNCKIITKEEKLSSRNLHSSNTSGYTGVGKYGNYKKWLSYVSIKGKIKCLGYFDTKNEAAIARNKYIEDNNLYNRKNVIRKDIK